ncbi:MAG: lasso peptide biosynthesis B2 protein [Pelosinus sp.]|nr:lasso peptide biosynthesis B2 protein [Pelosinus sp.]
MKLTWREKVLFISIFSLTAVIRMIILLLPFRWLAPFLGEKMQESVMKETNNNYACARHVAQIVTLVSRHTPWESKCLVQAIAAKLLLHQRGISTTLYLGVCKDQKGTMLAHAWLRCGEMIVTGGQGRGLFTIVGRFAD